SPYANIVVVRKGEENQEKFQKLLNVLQSEKVKKYIEETYDGAVIPAL
ncbi:MAG TPA: MetQ/NlpA family ABC transporter substrate-binding protein, partial [Tissierellaceae bacterium]